MRESLLTHLNPKQYPHITALRARDREIIKQGKKEHWSIKKIEAAICRMNPLYWMENYGFITEAETGADSEVGIVPFVLNEVQVQIAERVSRVILNDPFLRFRGIVLKFRQAGISTLFAAYDYWFMRFRHLNAFAIADLARHTDNIFKMIQLCHDRDECGIGLKDKRFAKPRRIPMPRNKTGLHLSNGSMLELDSGENSNAGTSQTLQIIHCSETSKWRDPETTETSLFNTTPRRGFSFIVKESTAFDISTQGGAKYAKDCETAQTPDSEWEHIFIKWADLDNCYDELEPNEALEKTNEERELQKIHHLKDGHIKFRRKQIDLLGGSVDKFKQEFPIHPQEPFLVTGSYYFDAEQIRERIAQIKFFRDMEEYGIPFAKNKYKAYTSKMELSKRGLTASIRGLEKSCVTPKIVSFSLNDINVTIRHEPQGKLEEGCALMYKEPEKNAEYIVTVDAAEGKKSSDYVSDNSIVQVYHTYRREQVMEWGGLFDEEMTAKYAVMIAMVYNKALLAIEMNNKCGGTVAEQVKGMGYRRFFYRQKILKNRTEREMGWHTSSGNKKDVCSQLRLDFKNGDCILHSLALLEEMLWFTDKGGKLGAAPGHNDDRVMSSSIAMKIIQSTPRMQDPPRKKRREEAEPQIAKEYNSPLAQIPGIRPGGGMEEAIRRFY